MEIIPILSTEKEKTNKQSMSNVFDILNAEVGPPDDGVRKLEITNIDVKTITFKAKKPGDEDRTSDKVFLSCKTEDGEREFQISEAWNDGRKGKEVNGLWVQLDNEQKLISSSTLAKLIQYLDAPKISDLKGMHVTGYPDTKGYVVLTTYDMEDETEENILN